MYTHSPGGAKDSSASSRTIGDGGRRTSDGWGEQKITRVFRGGMRASEVSETKGRGEWVHIFELRAFSRTLAVFHSTAVGYLRQKA